MIYTTVSFGLCFVFGLRVAEFEVSGSLPTHAAWSIDRGTMRGTDGDRWVDDAISAAMGRAAAELGCAPTAFDEITASDFEVGDDTDEPEQSVEFLRVDDLDV